MQSEDMGISFFTNGREYSRQSLIVSEEESVFWNSDFAVGLALFVKMLEMLSDMIAMSLKITTIVGHPGQADLLNVHATFRCFVTAHCYTIGVILPVSYEIENATDRKGVTSKKDIREIRDIRSVVNMCDYVAHISMSK